MSSPTPAHDQAAQNLVAEALASGCGVRLRVRGGCMEPLLEEGDWVWVEPVERPLPGTIVLARSRHGNLVCHRVLEGVEPGYRLVGDRSFAVEEHPAEAVLGAVRWVERGALRLALGGPGWQLCGRVLVRWHLWSQRLQGSLQGRLLEGVRQRGVELVHRVGWKLGSRFGSAEEFQGVRRTKN